MAAFLCDPLDFWLSGIDLSTLVLTATHPASGISGAMYDGGAGGWGAGVNGTIVGSGSGGYMVTVTTIPAGVPLGVWWLNVLASTYGGGATANASWWFLLVTNYSMTDGYQSTLNSVDLVFDDEPSHLDPSDPEDGLYVPAYTITHPGGYPQRELQAIVYWGDNTLRLYFDGPLVPGQLYTISVTGIRSSTGNILSPDPAVASFTAYGADKAPVPLEEQPKLRYDIKNPQAIRDAPQGEPLGTFIVDDKGDIDIEGGRAYLRKRIFRRLATRKGRFFHEPDYGIEYDDKALMTPTKLRRLQHDIEQQVRREPDVVTARASVSEVYVGVVYVRLAVKDRFGDLTLETQIGGS